MKKTLFTILAVAALAACAKEEVVTVNQEAIAFDNTFVDNATKTTDNSFSATNLPETFYVYGTTKHEDQNAVSIFNGVGVTKNDSKYTYDSKYTQYWIEGNVYKFAALVNADVNKVTCVDLLPSTVDYTAAYETDGSVEDTPDLMYATATATGLAASNPDVAFTFNHLLANIKFTLKNVMTYNPVENLYEYALTDIKINNAYTSGTCTLATKVWSDQATDNKVVKFGDVAYVGKAVTLSASSAYARLLIPAEYAALNITFTLTTTLNTKVVNVEQITLTPAVKLEAGKAYNFVVEKGNPGEQIKFSVATVNNWETGF
jgi:hypothetical protein